MRKYITILMVLAVAQIVEAQDETNKITHIIDATYDSKSEEGYRFINRLDESPITFAQIAPELLQKFDLDDDSLIGSAFQTTYGTEKFYPEGKDAENSRPFKEELIILDLETIE